MRRSRRVKPKKALREEPIQIRAQRYADAIDSFKSVLKINPMRLSAREKLLRCYEKLGDREAAEVERKLVESLRSRTNTGAKSKK